MPVCIAGMHRSGTSMIARMLNQCGLSLGPEDELLPPNEFNTEGYWENEQFVQINDALLSHFGGGWDIPPVLPEGWQDLAELDPLRRRAQVLVERFMRLEPWGWKDPRASLTLPFWRSIIPDLRVLICVRNPLEVVVSLSKRAYCSDAFGLSLWLQYNQQALAGAAGLDHAVTHYDAYYEDAPAELQRVLDALGIAWVDADLERATASIVSGVRHHRVGMQDLLDAGISKQVLDCYTHLLELGRVRGPLVEHTAGTLAGDLRPDTLASRSSYAALRLVRLEAELQHLRKYVRNKDNETAMLTGMLEEQIKQTEGMTARIQTLTERNIEYRAQYLDTQSQLARRDQEFMAYHYENEKKVAWLEEQLVAIKSTRLWQLGNTFWALSARIRGH